MAATPTTDLGFQNFFQATLTGDITASSTDILMDNIPNASQGFLVIEPDSSTNREVIFYTSKTALKVVCPSAADGRGQDDTTATSHSTGATVVMAPIAAFYEALQSGQSILDNAMKTRHITDGNVTSVKLAEAFLRGRLQAITTNTAPTGLTVQFGWSFVTGTGASLRATKAMTFPTAFSSAPVVIMGALGIRNGSDPTAIGDFTKLTNVAGDNGWLFESADITASGFNATINRDVGNINAAWRIGFAWIAIGTV